MKVSCLQENLAKGLSIVGRSVTNRSALPVLSNILLSTDGEQLKLSATNLEIGISCWVGAKVEESGSITIPARLLTNFVNSLPPERIDLSLDTKTQTLNARCAHFEANLKGINAQEFPMVPGLDSDDEIIYIEPIPLKQLIKQVAFAATKKGRPILTGILAQIGPEVMTMSAADGFRLSTKTIPLSHPIDNRIEVIIPARALAELSKIITDQEEPIQVVITANSNQILFHMQGVDLVSQLIEGRFPDVTRIIPETCTTRTVLDTGNLLKAARISYLFARNSANIVKVNVVPGDSEPMAGQIVLTATSQELGDNVGGLDAYVEGEPIEISFNAKYLIEVLNIVDSPRVILETVAPTSPGVIKAVGDDQFIHVIMPMHLSK